MKVNERVIFRLIRMPCCGVLLCYVNHRLPNYCSECGKYVFKDVRSCVMLLDEDAQLKYRES